MEFITAVSYQPLEDDYIKIVRIPENSGYTLKCTANDLGTVDYSLLTISDDGEMQQQEIDNIPVDEGNVIRISDISGGDTKCSLEKNGETVKEYKPQIVSNEYVPVESFTGRKNRSEFKSRGKVFIKCSDFTRKCNGKTNCLEFVR